MTLAQTPDLVVVGAGLAGTVAALRARELGARTVLVERGDPPSDSGNTRLSGGTLHAALLSLRAPAAEIERRITEVTDGTALPDVAHTYATNCGRALDWLGYHRIKLTFRNGSGEIVFAPQRSFEDVHAWRNVGAHHALVELQRQYVAAGGELWSGSTVRELTVADRGGGVAAVAIDTNGAGERLIPTPGVVLADGGFQGNPAMLRKYIGPAADTIKLRGSSASRGDAIHLAKPFRPKLLNMEFFYGHCLHRDALKNDRLWPMPIVDGAVERGIVVDHSGHRVVDEGLGGIAVANALARLDDPGGAWVVLDAGAWESLERSRVAHQPHVYDLESRGGVVHSADSLKSLARLAGVDPQLSRTIHHVNQAAAEGATARIARTGVFRPLLMSPFRAIPLIPGITFTMGGLAIDGRARIVADDDSAVPGLYAAGGSAAGLQGSPRGGYVGGLSAALVFGLVAGEAAVNWRRQIWAR